MKALRVLGYSFVFALIWSCLMFEAVLVEAKTPKIEVGEYVIEPGAKVKISIKNKPKKLISIKYSTSDKTIATVSKKGYITGHNIGDTEIKVSLKYLNSKGKKINKSLKCNVIVMTLWEDDEEDVDDDTQVEENNQINSVPYVPEGTSYYKNDDYSVNYYRYSNEPFVELVYECLSWPIGNVIGIIGYDGSPTDLIIPDKMEYHFRDRVEELQVVSISGFEGCETLTGLELPKDRTTSYISIEESAFANCGKLEKVVFSNNVNVVWDKAFMNCQRLREICFGEDNYEFLSIGNYAFANCTELEELNFPRSEEDISIYPYAFMNCTRLKSVTLIDDSPEYVHINHGSFKGCQSLMNVTLPDYTMKIESDAFIDSKQATIMVGTDIVPAGEAFDIVICRVRKVCSQIIKPDMDQIGKIKSVFDWICDNVTYSGTSGHRNAYAGLIFGECVCVGYSDIFYCFMKELGIPCLNCWGTLIGSEDWASHEWNLVKLENGKYYLIDVTADLGKTYHDFLKSPLLDYNAPRPRHNFEGFVPDWVYEDAVIGDYDEITNSYADQDFDLGYYLAAR